MVVGRGGIVEQQSGTIGRAPLVRAPKTRVLLIDDHPIFLQGVRLILQATPDIAVAGEATSDEAGLRLFDRLVGVDVVVTDLLPDISGLDVVRRAKAHASAPRVLLLTLHAEDEYIRGMIAARADGYVLKLVAVEELVAAIRSVARGEAALSPPIARRLLAQARAGRGLTRRVDALTPRERHILALLADGLTSKEIARQLDLSVNTIDTHRARILSKFGVSNTPAAIRLAIRRELLSTIGGDWPPVRSTRGPTPSQ